MNGDLGNFYRFLWNSCLALHTEIMIAYPDLKKPDRIIHLWQPFDNLEVLWLDRGGGRIEEAVGSCDHILGANQASSTKTAQTDGKIRTNKCYHPGILIDLEIIYSTNYSF